MCDVTHSHLRRCSCATNVICLIKTLNMCGMAHALTHHTSDRWHSHPAFISALAGRIEAGLEQFEESDRHKVHTHTCTHTYPHTQAHTQNTHAHTYTHTRTQAHTTEYDLKKTQKTTCGAPIEAASKILRAVTCMTRLIDMCDMIYSHV